MMQVQGLQKFTASLIPQNSAMRRLWMAVLLLCAALLLLPELIKFDGRPHADWQQFLGRFHPLAVHIPIGLIVLVPVLEIAGKFRPALREASSFVLSLACAASLGSLVLGYLLAHGSGDTGVTLMRHMWGGIALSIILLLCLLTHPAWATGSHPRVYPALLCVAMLALAWTAHMGGSITHGDDYLTTYMPTPFKEWFPSTTHQAVAANPDSFYSQHIQPILDSNCISCHGASKTQGGLRLDSYDLLMKGGKDGPVIVPRNAATSILLARITLPVNDPHFMPAEGHPPLKTDDISVLRAWIEQGASPIATSLAGITLPGSAIGSSIEPVGDYSALLPEIQQMQQSQGAKLVSVSANPADGLILTTVNISSTFNDTQLASFAKFAPFIVEADLARTAVTDAGFDTLSKFTHLRTLHLESTAITGQSLGKLGHLSQLSYLNLSDTKVDQSSLTPIHSMPNLQHLYLFNTPAQP
jgi:hypothetical protein